MEYIIVKKIYVYEVPTSKYNELLEGTNTKKLFHLEDGTEEFRIAIDTLEEIARSKTLEAIEISDEEY